jgi:putative transposase
MKKSRFSEEQIVGIIREAESGTDTVEAVCRKHSISAHAFYRWRNKFGGLEVKDATRLKELERENQRLKKIVADQALDLSILKEINSKKW